MERAAYDGALSYIKIIFLRNATRCFQYHGTKFRFRKSALVAESILTPSGTPSGPTIILPIMLAQSITHPLACCHLNLIGF